MGAVEEGYQSRDVYDPVSPILVHVTIDETIGEANMERSWGIVVSHAFGCNLFANSANGRNTHLGSLEIQRVCVFLDQIYPRICREAAAIN